VIVFIVFQGTKSFMLVILVNLCLFDHCKYEYYLYYFRVLSDTIIYMCV